MAMPGMIVVKEEAHHVDADNVAAFLQAQGIDATVVADDAGGTIPSFDETRFAKVVVAEADADEARRLIAEQEALGLPWRRDEEE